MVSKRTIVLAFVGVVVAMLALAASLAAAILPAVAHGERQ
jgi:hypothetical protein